MAENAESVRRTIELFNQRDIEGAFEFAHPDFVMDWSNSIGPLKGVYVGRDAIMDLWRTFTEAWESVRWEPQEITELDNGRVLVVNRVKMRGKGSGAEVDATGVQVWTLRDGKGERVELFQSKADALAALAEG